MSDKDYLVNENGATPIPQNFFVKPNGNVFRRELEENHAAEQYFWTQETVEKLVSACGFVFEEKTCCCLMTPSMGQGFLDVGREETVLDIDKRLDFLPGFRYYDVTKPHHIDDDFRLLIIDPPFFLIPVEQVREAVDVLTKHDYNTKIMIAFLKRGEQRMRKAFKEYNLVPTHFPLQYTSIKPNKWSNFVLYSNVELPGVKKMKE